MPKEKGGLGLISIDHQILALATKLILWVISHGEHQLKMILREKIYQLSLCKHGVADFSWVFLPCKTLPLNESQLWTRLYSSYNQVKQEIFMPLPQSIEDWHMYPT